MLNLPLRPLAARATSAFWAAALTLTVAFLLLAPALASAQSAGSAAAESGGTADDTKVATSAQLGQNVANLIEDFTKPLLVAVAGAMSFAAFGARNHGRVGGIMVITTVIGGFVYASDTIVGVIKQLWGSLA
jgi:hypothetical protein